MKLLSCFLASGYFDQTEKSGAEEPDGDWDRNYSSLKGHLSPRPPNTCCTNDGVVVVTGQWSTVELGNHEGRYTHGDDS